MTIKLAGPIKSVRILISECKDMADDKYKCDCPERDRINVQDEYTLGYWKALAQYLKLKHPQRSRVMVANVCKAR